jgi:hypothetical protein
MAKRQLKRSGSTRETQRTRSRWITWSVFGGLAIVIAAFLAYLAFLGQSGPAKVSSPAPDFTLKLLNGNSVTLSSLRGRTVLINFWAST